MLVWFVHLVTNYMLYIEGLWDVLPAPSCLHSRNSEIMVHVHVFTLSLVSSFTGADKSLPLCKLTWLVIFKGKTIGFTVLKQESLVYCVLISSPTPFSVDAWEQSMSGSLGVCLDLCQVRKMIISLLLALNLGSLANLPEALFHTL